MNVVCEPTIQFQPEHENQPFFRETVTLFESVRRHDFATLAALCQDDFGIVDLNTDGSSVIISNRAEWEQWFHALFARLDEMEAETNTEILRYQALQTELLGYSVVDFCQTLTVGGRTARFTCVATIIWKQVLGGWQESRWHCSLVHVA
jgi:ketosteroid isomerase-like protein